MATAQSPTCTPSELPRVTGWSGWCGIDLEDRDIRLAVEADQLGAIFGSSP